MNKRIKSIVCSSRRCRPFPSASVTGMDSGDDIGPVVTIEAAKSLGLRRKTMLEHADMSSWPSNEGKPRSELPNSCQQGIHEIGHRSNAKIQQAPEMGCLSKRLKQNSHSQYTLEAIASLQCKNTTICSSSPPIYVYHNQQFQPLRTQCWMQVQISTDQQILPYTLSSLRKIPMSHTFHSVSNNRQNDGSITPQLNGFRWQKVLSSMPNFPSTTLGEQPIFESYWRKEGLYWRWCNGDVEHEKIGDHCTRCQTWS